MPSINPSQDNKCDHDWETISVSDEYFHIPGISSFRYLNIAPFRSRQEIGDANLRFYTGARQLVCLKCGVCVDQIAAAEREVAEREKEQKSRKELARLLWDKCYAEKRLEEMENGVNNMTGTRYTLMQDDDRDWFLVAVSETDMFCSITAYNGKELTDEEYEWLDQRAVNSLESLTFTDPRIDG